MKVGPEYNKRKDLEAQEAIYKSVKGELDKEIWEALTHNPRLDERVEYYKRHGWVPEEPVNLEPIIGQTYSSTNTSDFPIQFSGMSPSDPNWRSVQGETYEEYLQNRSAIAIQTPQYYATGTTDATVRPGDILYASLLTNINVTPHRPIEGEYIDDYSGG